jgi:PIN domain nuclease of toxin-antitoxin system
LRILLDTHIWIWWVTGQKDLPETEREVLNRTAEDDLPCISAISLWECQMLHARGRLHLEMPLDSWLFQAASPDTVDVLPLNVAVIVALDQLPRSFHGDPADRIIVATARAANLPLATHDRKIRRSRAALIWKS